MTTTAKTTNAVTSNKAPCARCGGPLNPHCGYCTGRVREFRRAMQDAGVPGYER